MQMLCVCLSVRAIMLLSSAKGFLQVPSTPQAKESRGELTRPKEES